MRTAECRDTRDGASGAEETREGKTASAEAWQSLSSLIESIPDGAVKKVGLGSWGGGRSRCQVWREVSPRGLDGGPAHRPTRDDRFECRLQAIRHRFRRVGVHDQDRQ